MTLSIKFGSEKLIDKRTREDAGNEFDNSRALSYGLRRERLFVPGKPVLSSILRNLESFNSGPIDRAGF